MKNENKIEVKFKLDKHRFVWLEVEKEKLPLVRENNREISRNEKREVRHESIYSLEAIAEGEGNELADETTNAEEEIIERETIAERNKRLYAAIRTLSPRQQEIIHKVYFEEKSQRAASKDLGVSKAAISIQLTRAMRKLKKLLEKWKKFLKSV